MAEHSVRTTFQPDREVVVDDSEYEDLKRQGLLVADKPAPSKRSTGKTPAAPPAGGDTTEEKG